jgi:hypothetical protein
MLTDFLTKYKRLLIIGGGVISILLIGWSVYYTMFFFHITNVSPNPNNISYLSPRLVVEFNKDLVADSAKVSSTDAAISSSVSGKQLIINLPADLEGNKTYVITINAIASKNGDVIKDHSISLKTVLNSNSLSDADKKTILDKQQASKTSTINDPIFSHLPHSTLDYSMSGSFTNDVGGNHAISIDIEITLSAADAKIDSQGAVERYHQEALDYLRSLKDIDSNNYDIFVNVINPTL